jgi:serine protease DegQ
VLGDSDAARQGDWCLAIGSAFGQKPTVTSGMISGVNQVARINGCMYKGLIEMNCKSKYYFVGGPLINDEGEVIGIIVEKGYATPGNRIAMALSSLAIPGF